MRYLIGLILIFTATSCATPQAAYQRGVYAAEARAKQQANADRQAQRAIYWHNQTRAADLAALEEDEAAAVEFATKFSSIAEAVYYTQHITKHYENQRRILRDQSLAEALDIESDQLEAQILGEVYLDISQMSDAEQRVVVELGRHAARRALDIGVETWTKIEEENQRRAELKRLEKARAEAEAARRVLQEEREHHNSQENSQ